jgi:hypothetical protein
MKLKQLLPSAQKLEITLPDGSPTGIVLSVVGQDSVTFRDCAKKWGQLMLDKAEKPNLNELETQNAELTAAFIVGWDGIEGDDGAPMIYSKEKALELMSNPELSFVREQVEEFARTRTHFFRTSAVPVVSGSEAGSTT